MSAMSDLGVRGAIVVNSSAMSHIPKSGFEGVGLYAATKAAADMIVRYAAIEGSQAGVLYGQLLLSLTSGRFLSLLCVLCYSVCMYCCIADRLISMGFDCALWCNICMVFLLPVSLSHGCKLESLACNQLGPKTQTRN